MKGLARAPSIAQADIDVMFNTNVNGLIAMTQAILPIFLARGEDGGAGDIINVGSIAGREPYPGGSIYCATKAAVRSFTEALRKELVATRVRVIEIDPGQVETEFSVVRFYGDKEAAKKVYEGVEPLTGEDIAEVVVFAATRRENVVIADTLIYPSHQVSCTASRVWKRNVLTVSRVVLLLCTGRQLEVVVGGMECDGLHYWMGCTVAQVICWTSRNKNRRLRQNEREDGAGVCKAFESIKQVTYLRRCNAMLGASRQAKV